MQSTGHSSMHALSSRSTQGSAMMYVTGRPLSHRRSANVGRQAPPRLSRGVQDFSITLPGRSIVLGPADVGKRVVIRRIVAPAGPEPAEAPLRRTPGDPALRDNRPIFSDLLGELVEWTESNVTVRTRAGAVQVNHGDIARAKTIPTHRRLSATEALELVAAKGWPAAESERLGDWWLRATAGWT